MKNVWDLYKNCKEEYAVQGNLCLNVQQQKKTRKQENDKHMEQLSMKNGNHMEQLSIKFDNHMEELSMKTTRNYYFGAKQCKSPS